MSQSVDFALPEQLTVVNVQVLHEQLETLVDDENNDSININAENVSKADTAGIQLIYALVGAARERQISLNWQKPSESIKNAVHILGLSEHISFN